MLASRSHILLVEDQEPVRASLQRALQHCGYQVTAVADAAEAQVAWVAGPFDLLLSDISLTGNMNGMSLASWARERAPLLPVLLISGMMPPQMPTQLLHDRRVKALSKPFGIAQLLAVITELFQDASRKG